MDFSKHVARVLTVLGEDAFYLGDGTQYILVHGVFDTKYVTDKGFVTGAESFNTAFTMMRTGAPAVQHGDRIQVRGTDYVIVNIKPDGVDAVVLILKKSNNG